MASLNGHQFHPYGKTKKINSILRIYTQSSSALLLTPNIQLHLKETSIASLLNTPVGHISQDTAHSCLWT